MVHPVHTDFAWTHVCSRRYSFSVKDFNFSDSDSLVTTRIRFQAFCSLFIYIFILYQIIFNHGVAKRLRYECQIMHIILLHVLVVGSQSLIFSLNIIKDFHFFIFKFINVIPQKTPFEA